MKKRSQASLLGFFEQDYKKKKFVNKHEPSTRAKKVKVTTAPQPKQMFLDLGQKNFGVSSCKVCGMMFSSGLSEDDTLHKKFHAQYLKQNNLKLPVQIFVFNNFVHLLTIWYQ